MSKIETGFLNREPTIENLPGKEKAKIVVQNWENPTPERKEAFEQGQERREAALSRFSKDGLRGQLIGLGWRAVEYLRNHPTDLRDRIEKGI